MEQSIQVGKKFPKGLPEGEALLLDIEPEGMILCVRISNVERLEGYGLHVSREFPYGLMLWYFKFSPEIEVSKQRAKMLPFNIREHEHRAVSDFILLPKEKTILTQVLINDKGIVYDIIHCYLDPEYVQTLQDLWSDTSLDWSEYDGKYKRIREDGSIVTQENTKVYLLDAD